MWFQIQTIATISYYCAKIRHLQTTGNKNFSTHFVDQGEAFPTGANQTKLSVTGGEIEDKLADSSATEAKTFLTVLTIAIFS